MFPILVNKVLIMFSGRHSYSTPLNLHALYYKYTDTCLHTEPPPPPPPILLQTVSFSDVSQVSII